MDIGLIDHVRNQVTISADVKWSPQYLVDQIKVLFPSKTPSLTTVQEITQNNLSHHIDTTLTQVLFIGQVECGSHGNLLLTDKTGSIPCKFMSIDSQVIKQVIVLLKWTYVFYKDNSYIEVLKYHSLTVSHFLAPPTSLDLASAIICKRDNITINATVCAVSSPIKNDTHCICLVKLQSGEVTSPLIIMEQSLLYLSHLLIISQNYIFTNLRNAIMNKGQHTEGQVLSTTHLTQIYCTISCSLPLTIDSNLISYQGVITGVVLPEAGIYELDHCIRLYTYQYMSSYGLRPGACIKLRFVHLIQVTEQQWNMLQGFYCCSYSHLSFVHFSPHINSLYKPTVIGAKKNKLLSLVSRYTANDRVWLFHVYQCFKETLKGVASTAVILQLVDKVAQLTSSLRPNDEDPVSSFLSNPHSCGLPTPINSNHWLTIPAINTVQTYILPITMSPLNMDICEVKWTYIKSKFTEILVGHVTSDDVTGYLQLTDSTGQLHLTTPTLIKEYGNVILVTEFEIIMEQATVMTSSLHHHTYWFQYIEPLSWIMFPTKTLSPDHPNVKVVYFVLTKKHVFQRTSWQIEVLTNTCATELAISLKSGRRSSSTQCVLQFSGGKWYPYLQYGCLYSLVTTTSQLASLYQVSHNDIIELLEESSDWDFDQQVLDISQVIHLAKNKSQELVTFYGEIVEHSFRLDQHHGTLNSSNSRTTEISSTLYHEDFNPHYNLALLLKNGLHTITVYIDLSKTPIPLGLLPGTTIKCIKFQVMLSRRGNPYCLFCVASTIVPYVKAITSTPPLQLTSIYHLRQTLPNNIVLIQGYVVSVQHVTISLMCSTCHTLIGCNHLCSSPTPVLKSTARVILDDGSGECHLYADNDMVPSLLALNNDEWTQLLSSVEGVGHVTYFRPSSKYRQLVHYATPLEGQLSDLVSRDCVHRYVKCVCQPFMSHMEQEVLTNQENKSISFRLGGHDYTTLLLPRLQMKLLEMKSFDFRVAASNY